MEAEEGAGEGVGLELLSRGRHVVVLDTSEWAARNRGGEEQVARQLAEPGLRLRE